MLILPPRSPAPPQTLSDHLNDQVVHYLPPGVTLAQTASGLPDFFLLRYAGDFATAKGGLLRLQLQFKPASEEMQHDSAASGRHLRAVAFDQGYFRVRLRSQLTDELEQVGSWHALSLTGPTLATTALGLAAREAEILKQLLEEGRNSVEVELDLRYQGLVPGIPGLVTADVPALRAHLLAHLGAEPVRADQVIAAVLSLPETNPPLTWRSFQPEQPEPIREDFLTETAWRALESLFQPQPAASLRESARYRLRPATEDAPSVLSWDLLTPRLAERAYPLIWQSGELAPYLTDPDQRQTLFPVVNQLGLFGTTEIHVVNHLPCDPHYLQEIRVALRFLGRAGVPEYHSVVFTPDSATLAQLRVVFPALTPFQLDYQVTAVLAPPGGSGWPTVRKQDFVAADGTVVEINRQTADLEMVQVSAEPSVFEQASRLVVELGPKEAPDQTPDDSVRAADPTQVTLTAEHPSAWVTLPGVAPDTPLQMRCVAYPTAGIEGSAYIVMAGDVLNREVHIAAYQLEVLAPDYITLQSAAPADQFAFVAVAVAPLSAPAEDEGRLYSLPPGESRRWPLFRTHVFEALQFRYQIHYVAYDAAGQSQPMATTEWVMSTETSLWVSPPTYPSEPPPEPLTTPSVEIRTGAQSLS
ncbi:MAG: hypothetical protein AAGF01_09885 [Cyanobacteria bacterium P01_G01_bin.38]